MEFDKKEEAYGRVHFKILNFLSFKQRSEKEVLDRIEKYLSKIHLPSREIDEIRQKVLSRLKEDGYLKDSNDLDFSTSYIRGLINSNKPTNKIKVSQFLLRKGVSKEIIQKALENLDNDFVYQSVLKEAEKKLRLIKGEDTYSKKKKLMNFLYRKGYPFEIITSVVDTLL